MALRSKPNILRAGGANSLKKEHLVDGLPLLTPSSRPLILKKTR